MRSIVEVGASVPAFLGKLWKLVNDSETDHLISWSPGGKTFFIKNQAEFARILLPQYYKHNNMASFIRQLNMYGFHKITSVENGGLRYEKDEIEFSHPCFMKGHAYLLEHIKRKIANPKSIVSSSEGGEKLMVKPELMNKVLADVKQMKGKQESMDAKFSVMKQENEALWREVAVLRQKHIKQQQIVNNLIQFLMSLVQPARSANMSHGVKRRYQLMINDAAHNSRLHQNYAKNPKLEQDLLDDLNEDVAEEGPIIHELIHEDIPSPVDPSNFVTIELPNVSPDPRPSTSVTPTQYHVTMEDGEDPENVESLLTTYPVNIDTNKTATSPADVGIMSPPLSRTNGRNVISPSEYTLSGNDMRLPADIFASDDSVGDSGIPMSEALPQHRPPTVEYTSNKEALLPDDLSGYFIEPQSIKQEITSELCKNKKNPASELARINLSNIKTELQDNDWNNMTLATVNNNSNLTRSQSMNIRDIFNNNEDRTSKYSTGKNKNELDDHLDTMQSDIESLRELLRSDTYSFDANTLLGLFGSEDPFYGLNFNNTDERTKGNPNAQETNQLMSYTGNVPDFGDFNLAEDETTQDEVLADPLLGESSALNTPKVTIQSPYYPSAPGK